MTRNIFCAEIVLRDDCLKLTYHMARPHLLQKYNFPFHHMSMSMVYIYHRCICIDCWCTLNPSSCYRSPSVGDHVSESDSVSPQHFYSCLSLNRTAHIEMKSSESEAPVIGNMVKALGCSFMRTLYLESVMLFA